MNRIEWMCLPRIDGPSVFGAMLDRGAGEFRLGSADVRVPAARRYLPGTMIVETTWSLSAGWAVVRDALHIGPWRYRESRAAGHQCAPTDHSAEQVLLRTIRCLEGAADFVLNCDPAFDYGRQHGSWRYTANDYGSAERAAAGHGPIRLTTDLNLGFGGPRAVARHRLHAGDQRLCALSWDGASPPRDIGEARRRSTRTMGATWATSRRPAHTWRSSTPSCT